MPISAIRTARDRPEALERHGICSSTAIIPSALAIGQSTADVNNSHLEHFLPLVQLSLQQPGVNGVEYEVLEMPYVVDAERGLEGCVLYHLSRVCQGDDAQHAQLIHLKIGSASVGSCVTYDTMVREKHK